MTEARFIDLLGNPRTIGLVAFLLSIPIGLIAALTATHDPLASSREVLAWIAIGVLAQLAVGAALLVGNLLLVWLDVTGHGTRVVTILVAFGAGAVRGVCVGLLPEASNLPTTTTIPIRILSSAIIFGLWLLILGAALGANDRYRADVGALVEELATRELQLRIVDAHQVSIHSSHAAARIAESTSPLQAALGAEVAAPDHARTARLVQDAIEERLRPLSHQFWFEREPQIETPSTAGSLVRRVVGTPIPWRRAIPVMSLLLVGNSLVRWGWPAGFFSGLVASALVAIIVITFTSLGSSHRQRWNSVMYVVLFLVPAPAAVLVIEHLTDQPQRASVNFVLALGVPTAFLLGAAATVVIVDRRATIHDLRSRIAEPTWDAHLGELHRRHVESEAASFLHNTVQSRLVAASLQLEQAAAEGDQERADGALQEVREVLELASTTAGFPLGPPPSERLSRLPQAWRGIATVTIEVPDTLEPDVAWRPASEAVEECVTNAVRHGHATRVAVLCHQTPDAIEITIDDDGSGSWNSEGSGLGHHWMARVTGGQWSITPALTGATVAMRIPT